ncbi:hypothetical protein ACFQZ4_22750 [Catellatospora coxensis]
MAIAMKTYDEVTGPVDAVETLATKIGIITLALVLVHLGTVLLLGRLRRQMQGNRPGCTPYQLPRSPGSPPTPRRTGRPTRAT